MSYKDSVKAYNQWWAKLNTEKIAKRKREWYLAHENEVREYNREWRAKNPDKVRAYWEKAWQKKKAKADRYTNQSVTEGKGDENAN